MKKEYLFKNLGTGNTIVIIDGNKLSIIRKGVRSFMNFGLKGEKTILLNQISAVQLKKCGMTAGYIQFVLSGSRESKNGLRDALKDENTVTFNLDPKNANANAEEIKNYIEEFNANQNSGNTIAQNVKTPIEQVKELKELLDMGAISQEEFDQKKKELLNL